MAVICPSVTATDPHTYREQMARIEPFAKRVHIDFADGVFAPQLINPIQAYWPESVVAADLHLMFKKPSTQLETVISLNPNLVIIHAEADDDVRGMLLELQSSGIKAGIALLQATQPEDHLEAIVAADHILLFSGDLGHFGGTADLQMLRKIATIRGANPTAELGWDGGVTAESAPLLAEGGIEVLVSGGYIQRADDPAKAFETLQRVVTSA